MKLLHGISVISRTYYANDFSQGDFSDGGNAFNPALWAQESLAILEEIIKTVS